MNKHFKILITSGGTKVPIDSVRHIGNMSTGRAGAELAYQFIKDKHTVIYFHSKGAVMPSDCGHFSGTEDSVNIQYENYEDYKNKLIELVKKINPDIVVSAAAVSDYGVKPFDGKISSDGEITLTLTPLPKVLPLIKQAKPEIKLIGFKLVVGETLGRLEELARRQIEAAGCEIVAGNDLNNIRKGNRSYVLFYKNKDRVAHITGENIYRHFAYEIYSLYD